MPEKASPSKFADLLEPLKSVFALPNDHPNKIVAVAVQRHGAVFDLCIPLIHIVAVPGEAGLPAVAFVEIAPQLDEGGSRSDPVIRAAGSRKTVSLHGLGPQLQEQVQRGHPSHLHALVGQGLP